MAYRPILPQGFSFTTTITLAALTNDHRVDYVSVNYAQRHGRSKIRPIKDTLGFTALIIRTVLYFNPLKIFYPVAGVILLGSYLGLACGLNILIAWRSWRKGDRASFWILAAYIPFAIAVALTLLRVFGLAPVSWGTTSRSICSTADIRSTSSTTSLGARGTKQSSASRQALASP